MQSGIFAILVAIPLVGLGVLSVTSIMSGHAPDGVNGCDMGGMMGGMMGGTDGMLQECNAMMAECRARHPSECGTEMTYEECRAMMDR